jgi:hypothetical protein
VERIRQAAHENALGNRLLYANHFLVFGEQHLRYILNSWLEFYHLHRPHQGLGNVRLEDRDKTLPELSDRVPLGKITCHESLGGRAQVLRTQSGVNEERLDSFSPLRSRLRVAVFGQYFSSFSDFDSFLPQRLAAHSSLASGHSPGFFW